jgi:hypothetical protein
MVAKGVLERLGRALWRTTLDQLGRQSDGFDENGTIIVIVRELLWHQNTVKVKASNQV